MYSLRFTIVALVLLISTAARAADGEIHVYLQPLPRQADRVVFSVDAVTAVNDTGSDVSLALALSTVKQPDAGRQRLLASGRAPDGSYAGLTIRIGKASLTRDGGFTALEVPSPIVRVTTPFLVPRGKAVVLWVVLEEADSAAGDASFTPVFSGHVATRPMVSRAGFVSNARSNSITVFDKQLRQVSAAILVPGRPSGMALDQRAGRLYVACPDDDAIDAIDVAAVEVVERSRLPAGDRPREIALTADGRTLLAVNTGANSISVFDTSPLTRVERVAVGSGPSSLALEPSGRRAFVFNTLSSSVSVVDIDRRTVVGTIATDSAPLRGQFNARGDRLLVIHERSPYVTVIDPIQLTVLTRARLRNGMDAIRVDPRRNLVYIGGRNDREVQFYDPTTLLPIDAMKTTGGVTYLTLDVEDNSLYIIGADTRSVTVGNVATRKKVSEIDVGDGPYWIVVAGEE